MRWCSALVMMFFAVFVVRLDEHARGGEKKEGKPGYLVVVPPAGGQQVKLADWRLTLGTRRVAMLNDLAADAKVTVGPEYLEFREEKSTTFKNGILTLIPLTSIRKIDYDREKKTVSAVVLKDSGEEVTLSGMTKFTANKITIEAEAILEGLGQATVKFQGGVDKGLQSVAFPAPKATEKMKGAPGVIIADDKEKTKHIVYDLQPLYLVDGHYRVLPYVMFKKTVKVDMDKLAGLRFLPPEDKKKPANNYEVTLRDGAKHILSLLISIEGDKKKASTFVGLIGRVPVGYRVFHLDSILEYQADDGAK
jgi:hypothetical protein